MMMMMTLSKGRWFLPCRFRSIDFARRNRRIDCGASQRESEQLARSAHGHRPVPSLCAFYLHQFTRRRRCMRCIQKDMREPFFCQLLRKHLSEIRWVRLRNRTRNLLSRRGLCGCIACLCVLLSVGHSIIHPVIHFKNFKTRIKNNSFRASKQSNAI